MDSPATRLPSVYIYISGGEGGVFPKIRGTFVGVPITRTIVYWGLCLGPKFASYHTHIYIYLYMYIYINTYTTPVASMLLSP